MSLVLLVSFFSVSFCFAFDFNTIKDEWMPKIVQWWNDAVRWINNDLEPWIQTHIGEKSLNEFKKEFAEAINTVPATIQEVWTNIKGLFNQ